MEGTAVIEDGNYLLKYIVSQFNFLYYTARSSRKNHHLSYDLAWAA
jgi:hypothetical protein